MKFLLDQDVPDDLSHLLKQLRHQVSLLREVLPKESPDSAVFDYANKNRYVLLTCNRDDFVKLASEKPHHGLIVIIRRKSRAAEKLALFKLLERAGEQGIKANINFA